MFIVHRFNELWIGRYTVSERDLVHVRCVQNDFLLMPCFFVLFCRDYCNECCQKDDVAPTTRRYPKAVLEVCTCKFGAYPQIQAFIKSDRPAKFPNLQIRYLRGLDPIVKLYDENDNVVEVLSINKWNTDTVEEFFATHLMKQDDSDNDYLRTNRI